MGGPLDGVTPSDRLRGVKVSPLPGSGTGAVLGVEAHLVATQHLLAAAAIAPPERGEHGDSDDQPPRPGGAARSDAARDMAPTLPAADGTRPRPLEQASSPSGRVAEHADGVSIRVRRVGFEPTSPGGQRGLSPPCMPVPAPPQQRRHRSAPVGPRRSGFRWAQPPVVVVALRSAGARLAFTVANFRSAAASSRARLALAPRRGHDRRLEVGVGGHHDRVPGERLQLGEVVAGDDLRVVVARSEDHGVRADAGKFFWVGTTNGCRSCATTTSTIQQELRRKACRRDRASRASRGSSVPRLRASRSRWSTTTPRGGCCTSARSLGEDTAVHVLGTSVAGFPHISDPVGKNSSRLGRSLAGRITGRAPTHPVRVSSTAGSLARRHPRMPRRLHLRPCARRHGPVRSRADAATVVARPGRETVASSRLRRSRGGASRRRAPALPTGPRRRAPTASAASCVSALRGRNGAPRWCCRVPTTSRRWSAPSARTRTRPVSTRSARGRRGGAFVDVGAHSAPRLSALECGADPVVAIESNAAAVAGLLEMVAENELASSSSAGRPSIPRGGAGA